MPLFGKIKKNPVLAFHTRISLETVTVAALCLQLNF